MKPELVQLCLNIYVYMFGKSHCTYGFISRSFVFRNYLSIDKNMAWGLLCRHGLIQQSPYLVDGEPVYTCAVDHLPFSGENALLKFKLKFGPYEHSTLIPVIAAWSTDSEDLIECVWGNMGKAQKDISHGI